MDAEVRAAIVSLREAQEEWASAEGRRAKASMRLLNVTGAKTLREIARTMDEVAPGLLDHLETTGSNRPWRPDPDE